MRIRRRKADIDAAVDQILWCAQWQEEGLILIRMMRTAKNGRLMTIETRWLSNHDPRLEKKLRVFLIKYTDQLVTVLYSVGAYSRKRAKAEYSVKSRLVYVDADNAHLPASVPKPTLTVSSSKTNGHWFWVLSRPVSPKELQSINRALVRLVQGDKGGHSPAKLFRLPGFPNFKYDPPFRVRLKKETGKIHDVDELLNLADRYESPRIARNINVDLVVAENLNAKHIIKRYRTKLDSDVRYRLRQKQVYGRFSIRIAGRTSTYPGDDRSEIIWAIASDFRDAGATPEETLAVVMNSIFWRARERDDKAEDPERLIQRVFENVLEAEEEHSGDDNSLVAVDPADWADLPEPVHHWIMENWIPLRKVTLLYGDGGTGKTLLVLMLLVACATGQEFLGHKVKQCRVYAVLGENEQDDTHLTLIDICRHYGIGLANLRGKTRIASRAGFDNVLMAFRNGERRYTELFDALLKDILKYGPDVVMLETAADIFDGNENVRNEVRAFITTCCEKIAREANAAVIVCAHPSVSGMKSGSGTSGSTAWGNSARSRIYLYRNIDDKGDEADSDHRIFSRKKSNFARQGETIDLIWQDGVFVVNDPVKQHAGTLKIDQRIIQEVGRAFDAGTPWSAHHQAGRRHMVKWIIPECRQSLTRANETLHRLLNNGSIMEIQYDAQNHRKGLCTPEQAAKQARNKSAK